MFLQSADTQRLQLAKDGVRMLLEVRLCIHNPASPRNKPRNTRRIQTACAIPTSSPSALSANRAQAPSFDAGATRPQSM